MNYLKKAAIMFMLFELTFWYGGTEFMRALIQLIYLQDWVYFTKWYNITEIILSPLFIYIAWKSFVGFLNNLSEHIKEITRVEK